MGKYFIQTDEGKSQYAIVKARADVNTILLSLGYKPITLGSHSPIGFYRVLRRYYDIFSLTFLIRKKDEVFLQFPWIHNNKTAFYKNLFRNGAKIDCIIHDLDSLRYPDKIDSTEIETLKKFHSIIAHTPAMKDFLTEKGIEASKIKILHLFSYLTDDKIALEKKQQKGNCIIFAGNLEKSPFVHKLNEIASERFSFNLYGKGAQLSGDNSYVNYKGTFSPNHPGSIEGNWGLVWDGDSINTCRGLYGSYLRINSSHKISLYLACGIPVILWEESSLKDFIEKHKLGITVNSLHELQEKIENLSESDLKDIHSHVNKISSLLRNGEPLKSLITNTYSESIFDE